MENPFGYSNYVTGRSFCNRTFELNELLKYVNASQNVLLYSPRRYGKSSLIQQLFKKIKEETPGIGTVHVDLYGTVSEKDFITRTFQELNQLETNLDRLIKTIGKTLKGIRFNFSVEATSGMPAVSPSFEAIEEKVVLKELMHIIEGYSKKQKLVVAFDEFQEVAAYTEDGFEKRLRSLIQRHDNICYIFSGSRQHIITEMFSSASRAFYKLADSFPLKKIATAEYVPWIRALFRQKNVRLPDEWIKEVISRFENHPMYVQTFLFHLWEEENIEALTYGLIDRLETRIIARKSIEYSTLWETLTINQKKTLKLILINKGKNLYDADSLKRVSLKTGSLVTKALQSLVKKEIVIKNGGYGFQDIVFKKWLEQTYTISSS